MLSLTQRIQSIENGLTLDGNYQAELDELNVIEQEIPTYRFLGTPVWKVLQVKEDIERIRTWIREELENTAG